MLTDKEWKDLCCLLLGAGLETRCLADCHRACRNHRRHHLLTIPFNPRVGLFKEFLCSILLTHVLETFKTNISKVQEISLYPKSAAPTGEFYRSADRLKPQLLL